MNCERSTECGLYKNLVERGIVQKGGSCIKTEPGECPRYQFSNGKNVEAAQKIFRIQDVLKEPLPISREEIEILYPQKEEFV